MLAISDNLCASESVVPSGGANNATPDPVDKVSSRPNLPRAGYNACMMTVGLSICGFQLVKADLPGRCRPAQTRIFNKRLVGRDMEMQSMACAGIFKPLA